MRDRPLVLRIVDELRDIALVVNKPVRDDGVRD
jgi:hypothetical protein